MAGYWTSLIFCTDWNVSKLPIIIYAVEYLKFWLKIHNLVYLFLTWFWPVVLDLNLNFASFRLFYRCNGYLLKNMQTHKSSTLLITTTYKYKSGQHQIKRKDTLYTGCSTAFAFSHSLIDAAALLLLWDGESANTFSILMGSLGGKLMIWWWSSE